MISKTGGDRVRLPVAVTIPLPGDGQMGLLVTVESSDYTIGNIT